MKKILSTIIFAILCISANAQSPNFVWAKGAGGTGDEYGASTSTDALGNVYVTGSFYSSTLSFGTITLTNAGDADIFIVKYGVAGNVLWAKSSGGIGTDAGNSTCTDSYGNVYVTGYFYSSTISFGTITLTNAGNRDIFIVKYDPSGNVIWAKSAGNTNYENGLSNSIDVMGNVYLTGNYQSPTITFGAITLTNTANNGGSDIFIVKYDSSGNVLWAKNEGGFGNDFGTSITTDNSSNVFVTGFYNSTSITFGTITLTNPSSIGYANMYIVKYDTQGNLLWAKSVDGTAGNVSYSASTDALGNVFVTGYYISSIIFGTIQLNNTGKEEMFIVKYDSSGNPLWANGVGNAGKVVGYKTCTDYNGNVYVSGNFTYYPITFGTITLANAGNDDIYIVKYDALGNVLWAKRKGSTGDEVGLGISSNLFGTVYITGSFDSPSITIGGTTLTNAGHYDMFIAKLSTTTGIEESAFDAGIKIYPNPTSGFINIDLKNILGKNISFELYNMLGEILEKQSLINNETQVQLNVPAGMYFVRLYSDNNVTTQKIIVE